MSLTPSLHIVRRYGPVGGMERYVWELTHALAAQGHPVKILCEKAYEQPSANIDIHTLPEVSPKPRWISMLRFSRNVSRWISNFTDRNEWVIHSHERSTVHDITTFHGPPFRERKTRFLDFLSPRIYIWEYLEKRELCGPQVKHVQPNSDIISNLLIQHYPCCRDKLTAPAFPRVSEHFFNIKRSNKEKRIGFIGKEWQRKGLPFACKLVEKLRLTDPEITFIVAGPNPDDIKHLFSNWPEESYELEGWSKTEDITSRIDLLLHPAEAEPFGMVIAEANAAGLPVVISSLCGIAPLIKTSMGDTLALDKETSWLTSMSKWLQDTDEVDKLRITWSALANEQLELYRNVLDNNMDNHTK